MSVFCRVGLGLEQLTSLRNSDNVMSSQDGGDAVALNRRRRLVLAELDVRKHDGVQAGVIEL
jgi:hypothetical protein